MIQDIERALLKTGQFAQSQAADQLVIEAVPDTPRAYTVVAGLPEGDREPLLEQWVTAAFMALPDASIKRAEVIETDRWDDHPVPAAEIRLAFG